MPVECFIEKPMIIEALLYDGDNIDEVAAWAASHYADVKIQVYPDGSRSLSINDMHVSPNGYLYIKGNDDILFTPKNKFTSKHTLTNHEIVKL